MGQRRGSVIGGDDDEVARMRRRRTSNKQGRDREGSKLVDSNRTEMRK